MMYKIGKIRIVVFFLALIVFFTSCGKEDQLTEKVVNPDNMIGGEKKIKYLKENLGKFFEYDSMEFDYFGEKGIGMRVNKDEKLECYSIANYVEDDYRKEAAKLIKQDKMIDEKKLLPKIWKHSRDKDGNWNRELVSDDPILTKTKHNQAYNFSVIFNENDDMRIVLKISSAKGKFLSAHLFALVDSKWKELGKYTNSDVDNYLPVNINIDSDDNLIMVGKDGHILKYNVKIDKIMEQSKVEEISGIGAYNAGGKLYSIEVSTSQMTIYDSMSFVEEAKVDLPEKYQYSGLCICSDKQNNVYYVSHTGVYKLSEDYSGFSKVCGTDMILDFSMDDMIFTGLCASDAGEIYVQMYDLSKGIDTQKMIRLYPNEGANKVETMG